MQRTQNVDYYHLTYKCVLDLGSSDLVTEFDDAQYFIIVIICADYLKISKRLKDIEQTCTMYFNI